MNFSDKLETYARLLVCHGLNVQPGQIVNIGSECFHRELVEQMVKIAYQRGARYVNVDFIDPALTRHRILESREESDLRYVPGYIPLKYDSFVDEGAAVIRIVGSEDPDALADLPVQKVNDLQSSVRQSLKRYYVEGVGKSKVQWTVAAAATPKWARKIFPELPEMEAYHALWNAIFTICRADRKDCLEVWDRHQRQLRERAERLTEIKIKELHFKGPGTDLRVYLSPKALFKGGGETSARGVDFEANIPTEECFTTPDCRLTEGKVRVTRPVHVNGKLIHDLQLEFSKGKIVNFTAREGAEQFAAYIANDKGASYLGEVALVGIDSPIFQSGRIFEEILYDENAACHIAVGFAYRFCIEGGPSMSPEELEAAGCNDSHVHTDFMISSEETDVEATTYSGSRLPLIRKGKWAV